MGNGIPFYGGTDKHEDTAHHTGEAHAHLIQNDTPEEEHQQEYVDITVGSGEETVFGTGPAQSAFCNRLGKQSFQRSHYVGNEITAHHGERNNRHGGPAGSLAVAEFLLNVLCYCCHFYLLR